MEKTAGEESVLKDAMKKYDAAYSQKETFLLEVQRESWRDLKETLFITGKRSEWIKLDRLLNHNSTQKEHWRSR